MKPHDTPPKPAPATLGPAESLRKDCVDATLMDAAAVRAAAHLPMVDHVKRGETSNSFTTGSLSTLSQHFSVIGDSMLPARRRPPRASEVPDQAEHAHRRALASFGSTEARRVSGYSSLPWDDSVRLDLGSDESWPLLGDQVLLRRTSKAAIAANGSSH